MTDDQILDLAKQSGMEPSANPKGVNAIGRTIPQRWLLEFARLVESAALIKESARTADAVQRADHLEHRLDMANKLGNAAREELAQAKTRITALGKDAARLDWIEATTKTAKHGVNFAQDEKLIEGIPHRGCQLVYEWAGYKFGPSVRAAIDAAMKGK